MFELWVSERKNFHLRNALLLRKSGDYPNALNELNIAADIDKDPEACWFKGQAFQYGGFGLYQSDDNSAKYFELAEPSGWPNLTIHRTFTDNRHVCKYLDPTGNAEHVKYAVESGDAHAWFWHYIDNQCLLKDVYKQNHELTLQHFATCHKCLDFLSRTRLMIEMKAYSFIKIRLHYVYERITADIRLQELYLYVRALLYELDQNEFTQNELDLGVDVYKQTYKRVQSSIVCWLLCAKPLHLCPDVAKLIGKMIWATRSNPNAWRMREHLEFQHERENYIKNQKKKLKKC